MNTLRFGNLKRCLFSKPQNAIDDDVTEMTQKLEENQAKVEKLTKDWTEKWKEAREIMQVNRKNARCIVFKKLLSAQANKYNNN